MSELVPIIEAQRGDFVKVCCDKNINFDREAGFASQRVNANEYLGRVAMNNKPSIINAVNNVAAIGISLNPASEVAYLVPRQGAVCLDISYMGMMHLAQVTGATRFDITVVIHSMSALLGPFLDLRQFAFVLILRLGRLFRLFRVLRFIPNLDRMVTGARRALRASVGVFLALALVNLILAVMATLLFRNIDPKHFGNPVTAGYSIFQVFTVEGWNEIAEGLVTSAEGSGKTASLAVVVTVRMFFVVAVVVGGILGLSLANAVFVDQMMLDNNDALEAKVDRLTAEIRSLREEVTRQT